MIIGARMTARLDGPFVVFLIGMRINRWWKIWRWLPVAASMPRMLLELGREPSRGLLHAKTFFALPNIVVVQYWRSFDHLHRYAVDAEAAHLPAWRAFNRAIGSNGDVGIWHETFLVEPGQCESVYNNMPIWGLAMAGQALPAQGRERSARGRLGRSAGDDHPADV